jgi:hypothetical protein
MRPGQQNKRSRGRGNGGRKNVNPLSRSYESNGPDVKVRGNPATIAEKYVQLARDAQASGDSVMAENYFQHAEHYFRIISAAQAQSQARQEERERERAERQEQNDQEDGVTEVAERDEASSDVNAGDDAVAADAANDTAEGAAEEEAPKRPRRAPRARRPRRTKAEETAAETGEVKKTRRKSSVDLSGADQPKIDLANDDAPKAEAGPKPDDAPAKEAAE